MKCKFTKLLLSILMTLVVGAQLQAQTSCDYTLQMYDSYGDGWNGAQLTINVGAASSTYALLNDFVQDTGDSLTVTFSIVDGEPITLSYTPGFYEAEVFYYIYDTDGNLVYSAGPNPPEGTDFFTLIGDCPTCPGVSTSSVNITNITPSSAKVTWGSGGFTATYILEYGPTGFTPGTGLQVTSNTTTVNLTGLNENVTYDVYVIRVCSDTDQSNPKGPFSFTTPFITAPSTCDYKVKLSDTQGFGWSGATLTVDVNGNSTEYTTFLATETFTFSALQNYPISFTYTPPTFTVIGNSYQVIDPSNAVIFQDGPLPAPDAGLAFVTYACPTCSGPGNVNLSDIRSTWAVLNWESTGGVGTYKVEYGPLGFTLGTGTVINTTNLSATLSGLTERGWYDVYIELICGDNNKSSRVGPITFQTLWKNDVGISALGNPTTSCGLTSQEDVILYMSNFGGNPQSLIPYKFSINGETQPISVPVDGYYTGVIGNDSTLAVYFDNTYDFSTPGDYVIKAWTELDGDSDPSNDTISTTITSVPIVTNYPNISNFDDWSGGWLVGDDSNLSTWERGAPDDAVINVAVSGDKVWTTNLDGTYNLGEKSYLYSPCLDFSGVNVTPKINVAINYNTYFGYDGMWLEGSKDGGATWDTIGALGTGINWYNATSYFNQNLDFWTGASNGWKFAQNSLVGFAQKPDCRLRFVFYSQGFTPFGETYDGVAIDNAVITKPLADDLSAIGAERTDNTPCGSPEDHIKISITNFGTQVQNNFDVGYQVDGGTPVIENVGNLNVLANQTNTYVFNTAFNSTGGTHVVKIWTSLNNDLVGLNDTNTIVITTAAPAPLPVVEDFENGFNLPTGWDTDFYISNFTPVGNVLNKNLYSFNATGYINTNYVGPINDGDSISFDYRIINYSGGDATTLSDNDVINFRISADCGNSFTTLYTINATTHVPSVEMKKIYIDLSAYAGQSVVFNWDCTWGQGDYYVQFDNINLEGCPPNLGIAPNIVPATGPNELDGSIAVTPTLGTGPYTYDWGAGQTSNSLENIAPGTYTVTIYDAKGCSQVAEYDLSFLSNTVETNWINKLVLAPNPTNGNTVLDMTFTKSLDVNIEILNLMGQRLYQTASQHTDKATYQLDMSSFANGIYLIKINADNKTHYQKIIVAH